MMSYWQERSNEAETTVEQLEDALSTAKLQLFEVRAALRESQALLKLQYETQGQQPDAQFEARQSLT